MARSTGGDKVSPAKAGKSRAAKAGKSRTTEAKQVAAEDKLAAEDAAKEKVTADEPAAEPEAARAAAADSEAAGDAVTDDGAPDEADQDGETPVTRSAAIEELWQEVRVDPVKVALPGGTVGYTLRAYRPADELTPTEALPPEPGEEDPFAERERARAEQEAELAEAVEREALASADEPSGDEDEVDAAGAEQDADTVAADESAAADEEMEDDEEEDEEAGADEDSPLFLSHRGTLLLFATPEKLVSFINSDAPHDMAQLDTWATVVKRVRAGDIVPAEEDTYELDLVVENLRGGHDAWDLPLLISAGEFARDVGWALRLTPVITAMAPGSPLDDLDEALRRTLAGGVRGWVSRRRLRRIGAQQASLGWRTVIGKIKGAVDWRD